MRDWMYKLGLIFVVCGLQFASAQPAADGDEEAAGAGAPATVDRKLPVAPRPWTSTTTPADRTDWQAVARQSAFFTGIQHGFRLATEPGTRAGMKGPFFRGYVDSVGNLHGWGDGDVFYVNYVGHPMQGAVSGWIYIQNNEQARLLRIGRDPRYWRSRLKAMGAAWAYSTWFEIGPFSEASVGKIQSKRPQQGFVDHVVTPIIGTGWLVAEDFLDEKIALPFERRFQNNWARMLVRSWVNPSRSFSNALRFKAPWYRDNRGGILPHHYRPVYELAPEAPREFPKAAPFELTAVPFWTRFADTQCAGGGGQAAVRISSTVQIVGQLSGCQMRDLARNYTGDSLTYAIGPRWTPAADKRISPFAQVLIGGNKLTNYQVDHARETILKAEAKRKGIDPPAPEAYTTQEITHGLALLAGTGVDLRLNRALALRLGSLEYARSWAATPSGANSMSQGLQLSSGVILRMGTW